MAADSRQLSPGEQLAAGFAIGVGGVLVVVYGGSFVLATVASKAPKILGNKIAQFLVEDIGIGRLPLLSTRDAAGNLVPVTFGIIAATLGTTLFYLFGGLDTVIEIARGVLGVGTGGGGNKLADPDGFIWDQSSDLGRLQYITLNGSRIDP